MVRIERQDPFVENFFKQIAPQIAESFTIDQLAAIKMVYGGRAWGRHAVDIRFSFPFFWERFYVVFVAGRDKRAAARRAVDRKAHPLATFGNAVVTVLFAAVLLALAFVVIDTVAVAFSGGGGSGGFLRDLVSQFRQMLR
ncbi:MAG TPA: hypothetical protein VMF53_07945 [Alphaproteobacteria bacterium]|nr:hypothetical protein [Alphaproteobacteria bacterium]